MRRINDCFLKVPLILDVLIFIISSFDYMLTGVEHEKGFISFPPEHTIIS